MATNTRLPNPPADQPKRPQLVPGQDIASRQAARSALPAVLFAILVAILLIGAVLYYMPRAPKRTTSPTAAQVPVQPDVNQLQFSNLQISLAPTGGAMNLDGQVMNSGSRPVLSAIAELSFRDSNGKLISNVRQPLVGMTQSGNSLKEDNFGTDPLKPNQSRPFRITVDQVPAGWNHQTPEMRIVTVSSEGK